jgi:hypothetical protein
MSSYPLNYKDCAEFKCAEAMASKFIEGLEETVDKRPFFEVCLGIGGGYIGLKSKSMLPDDGFGHVDLGFIPNFTPAALVQALRAANGYGELCIVGALWFAWEIQFRGTNKGNEYGYNLCMTLLEDTLKAYFANQE